jgi:hypothetical protein
MEKITDLIFGKRFRVNVPRMATISEWELRELGFETSNNPEIDDLMFRQMHPVAITISRMAELWDAGYKVGVPTIETATSIYKDIERYIGEWLFFIGRRTMNSGAYPDDDLRLLDAFAANLYTEMGLTFDVKDGFDDSVSVILNPVAEIIKDHTRKMTRTNPLPERKSLNDLFDNKNRIDYEHN